MRSTPMLTIPGKLIIFVEPSLSSPDFVTYSSIVESSKIEFHGTLCEFHVIFCNSAFILCTLQEILMLSVARRQQMLAEFTTQTKIQVTSNCSIRVLHLRTVT